MRIPYGAAGAVVIPCDGLPATAEEEIEIAGNVQHAACARRQEEPAGPPGVRGTANLNSVVEARRAQ